MTNKQQKKTLTEMIMETKCPYNESYQGDDKRVLFVCSTGLLRSATAARIYAKKYNTRACGSAYYALIPLSKELFLWADQIVFVNEYNYLKACYNFDINSFRESGGIITILDIPDDYEHMYPELIKQFELQFEPIEDKE